MRKHAKPIIVRREKVRAALEWLCKNNYDYRDLVVDHSRIDSLGDEHVLPVHIEVVSATEGQDTLTARYEPPSIGDDGGGAPSDIFDKVVVTDVDRGAPSHELRAAALRHVKERSGAYVQIPHGPTPVTEFLNPALFPMIYPTLFPYGLGGFEHPRRSTRLTLRRQVKHLFNLEDRRFQEHYSFLFVVFNILQRRSALLHTSLKTKRSSFDDVAATFASVSPESVHAVAERVAKGDFSSAFTPEEKKVRHNTQRSALRAGSLPPAKDQRPRRLEETRANEAVPNRKIQRQANFRRTMA